MAGEFQEGQTARGHGRVLVDVGLKHSRHRLDTNLRCPFAAQASRICISLSAGFC